MITKKQKIYFLGGGLFGMGFSAMALGHEVLGIVIVSITLIIVFFGSIFMSNGD